jgi:hypothetical protein
MTIHRRNRGFGGPLAVAMIALCLSSAPVRAHPGPPATSPPVAQPVAPVVVTGRADPLGRSDRRLSRIKHSLPGDESRAPKQSGALDRLDRYARSHADPDSAMGQQRRMMQRAQGPAAGHGPDSGIEHH